MEEIKELEKVQPEKVTLLIKGKEREIKFNFKTWATIQKEIGGLKNLPKLQEKIEDEPFTTIPHLLFLGLQDKSAYTDGNGNSYPEITEDNILEDYSLNEIQTVIEVFQKVLYGALPADEESKKEVEATEVK